MERVHDIETFAADPFGRWIGGRTGLAWWHGPQLCGAAMWGHVGDPDLEELGGALALVEHPRFARMRVITDASGLESLSVGAFETLLRGIRERPPAREQIERQAIVHGSNMVGAAMAGFFQAAPVAYETRVFDALAPALAWIGAAHLEAELACAVTECRSQTTTLMRVRAMLALKPRVSLPAVAAELGAAPRSLQRRLEAAGTTFRREAVAARVRLAQERLAGGEDKIASVAHACGFVSSQHLAAAFRRLNGCSPTEWRARRRA